MHAGVRATTFTRACALAVLGALTVVAGCSGSGSNGTAAPDLGTPAPAGPPSAAALASVVGAARESLGQRATVSLRLAGSPLLGSAGADVTGHGEFDLSASRGQVELGQPTGPERVLFLPESVFVGQSGAGSVLPKDKVWISAGLTEQSLATNLPQFVTQAESLNPALLLSELVWGSSAASPLPPVDTGMAYSVVVDLTKAQSAVAGPSAAAFARAIGYQITEQTGAAAPTVTVEVVVDRNSRVVALRSSPPGAGIGTVTLGLSGWGVKVSVVAPPRALVADISSLAPGGERENAGGGDSDGA